ncbi:hypothetical protein D6C98_10540 [Aureobasidium pullulans]|nr:hypothetical protein D6D03_05426 [Aureobasidium pullulans]THY37977.1 hypothetical protein D6C98_10540 [Aureobasidium pullulans]
MLWVHATHTELENDNLEAEPGMALENDFTGLYGSFESSDLQTGQDAAAMISYFYLPASAAFDLKVASNFASSNGESTHSVQPQWKRSPADNR